MTEVERKFLLNYIPEKVNHSTGLFIRQGYLCIGKERETRVRQYGEKYFLTLKDGDGLSREETEVGITKKQFDELWPATKRLRVEKVRHRLPWKGRTVELDIFEGLLAGLQIAEIEFPDEEAAKDFEAPPWCGPEVTEDSLFRNKTLGSMDEEAVREKLSSVITPTTRSVGAIPVIYLNEKPHYVVVTTTGSHRWIFPKATPEDGRGDRAVAQDEAFEETGVEGELFLDPLQVYYWKGYQRYRIDYYPLRVEKLHMSWPESKQRDRKVCEISEARELLAETSFLNALEQLSKKV